MTGRHMGTATVRGNLNPHMPLTADEVTIPEIIQKGRLSLGQRTGILLDGELRGRPEMDLSKFTIWLPTSLRRKILPQNDRTSRIGSSG
jgi:hypothetical protein